jgi:hypothetical protein
MAEDQERRQVERQIAVEYKKPHFGPEETSDVILHRHGEEQEKKRIVMSNLRAQI